MKQLTQPEHNVNACDDNDDTYTCLLTIDKTSGLSNLF